MKCSDEPSENPLAACGNSYCETCYPDDRLRAVMKDLLEANTLIQKRISELVGVKERLESADSRIEELKAALIWVGSSEVAGESAEQVKACVRKAAINAIVKTEKDSEGPDEDDC